MPLSAAEQAALKLIVHDCHNYYKQCNDLAEILRKNKGDAVQEFILMLQGQMLNNFALITSLLLRDSIIPEMKLTEKGQVM